MLKQCRICIMMYTKSIYKYNIYMYVKTKMYDKIAAL